MFRIQMGVSGGIVQSMARVSRYHFVQAARRSVAGGGIQPLRQE
jgi:hypothetical protein